MTSGRSLRDALTGAVGTVGAALAISSGLGYLLLAMVARWLSEADYAVFLSTWGVVFGLASVLSVVEQEVSRQAAEARSAGAGSGPSAIRILILSTGATLTLALAIALSPLRQSIFAGSAVLAGLACLSTAGFGIQFFVRGVLIGNQRVREYSALLVIEAVSRLVCVLALAALLVDGRLTAFVAAVVTGSFAWLPFSTRTQEYVTSHAPAEGWGTLAGRVAILGASAGLVACLLTGYPAIVTAVVGNTEGLATLFAVISASRVPLVLLAPVQALAVPAVVRLVREGRTSQLHRRVLGSVVGIGVSAGLAAGFGWLLGPAMIQVMFGAQYVATPLMVSLVASATVVVGGVLLAAAALLAFQRYTSVLLTWGAGVAAALAALLLWPGGASERGVAGLVVASVTAFAIGSTLLVLTTRKAATTATGRLP